MTDLEGDSRWINVKIVITQRNMMKMCVVIDVKQIGTINGDNGDFMEGIDYEKIDQVITEAVENELKEISLSEAIEFLKDHIADLSQHKEKWTDEDNHDDKKASGILVRLEKGQLH